MLADSQCDSGKPTAPGCDALIGSDALPSVDASACTGAGRTLAPPLPANAQKTSPRRPSATSTPTVHKRPFGKGRGQAFADAALPIGATVAGERSGVATEVE